MDDVDRILRKKVMELSSRGKTQRCCSVSYVPGYVVRHNEQFRKAVLGCRVAFVMFFGKMCPYCQMFDPIFKQVGEAYGDYANFVKADVEDFYMLAMSLGIMGTPATAAFVDGQAVEVVPGFMTAPQFRSFVESVLSYANCK